MGKVAKIVPADKMAIAEKNGIPKTTVYKRVQAGWDLEKAISKPPRKSKRKRDSEGNFIGIGKAKPRSFTLPNEWDEKLELALSNTDLTQSEFVAKVIIKELKKMKLGTAAAETDEKLDLDLSDTNLNQSEFVAKVIIKGLKKIKVGTTAAEIDDDL